MIENALFIFYFYYPGNATLANFPPIKTTEKGSSLKNTQPLHLHNDTDKFHGSG
jgi:hypothetical protein